MNVYYDFCAMYTGAVSRARSTVNRFAGDERGDLVSSLGWMAIMALVLIAVKGVIDGKLVSYVNNVFIHLDRLFNP